MSKVALGSFLMLEWALGCFGQPKVHSSAAPAPITVLRLGVQIVSELFPPERESRRSLVVRIVAVQEQGSAWMAGLAPGDVITRFDGKETAGAVILAEVVERRYGPGSRLTIEASYAIPNVAAYSSYSAYVTIRSPGSGRWITEVPLHTTARRELPPAARQEINVALAALQKARIEAHEAIIRQGCSIPHTTFREILAALQRAEGQANQDRQSDAELELTRLRSALCDTARDGPITEIEWALLAITDSRKVDPCEYSPGEDLAKTIHNPLYYWVSTKSSFNSSARRRFELYLQGRDATATQKACFLDLIASRLTGLAILPARSDR